jgi:hypothetical protein
MRLDDLDAARGGQFRVLIDGAAYDVRSPDKMPWQHVMACLDLQHSPLTGLGVDQRITVRQAAAIFHAWRRHHDLPSFRDAQRLVYLIDRYHDDLAYDLQRYARADLGELWRARRWSRIIIAADRLPRTSHFSAAVANDLEHAEMLAKAMAEQTGESKQSEGPSLQDWSPERAALADVTDKLNQLIYYAMANAGVKNPPKPDPSPRPVTALARAAQRAERDRRQEAHESLVSRLLPHKRKGAE